MWGGGFSCKKSLYHLPYPLSRLLYLRYYHCGKQRLVLNLNAYQFFDYVQEKKNINGPSYCHVFSNLNLIN